MNEQITDLVVRKTITVDAPQQRAFMVFTQQLATWWPLDDYHIGRQAPQTAVLEPRSGGRWYETDVDGTECDWGRVLVWEPPDRVLLTWEIDADWRPDPAARTELEVRFIAQDAATTRVELEHRGLENLGARAEEMYGVFDSTSGWSMLLSRFADAART